jgi:hypothetical protein
MMVMQVKYETYYVPALYWIVGLFLGINMLSLMGGAWIALLPITIQASIIVSVYARKPWAYVVVRIWSALCIFSGVTVWLAVLLRGGEFSRSAGYMAFETLSLFMGVMFFKNAKAVLSQRVCTGATSQQVHHDEI